MTICSFGQLKKPTENDYRGKFLLLSILIIPFFILILFMIPFRIICNVVEFFSVRGGRGKKP